MALACGYSHSHWRMKSSLGYRIRRSTHLPNGMGSQRHFCASTYCWPHPYAIKGFDDNKHKWIKSKWFCKKGVDQTGPIHCLWYLEIAWLTLFKNKCENKSRISLMLEGSRLQNSLAIRSCKLFAEARYLLIRCWLIHQKSWFI